MITGEPLVMDFEQMAVVARWVTLKAIVAEHSGKRVVLTPRADRIAFKERGKIPAYFNIYIANHNMVDAAGYARHTRDLRLNGLTYDPPLFDATCNVQTISLMLGRVFVHLNAARVANFSIESRYAIPTFYGNSRIWPVQHDEMVWPRRPLLDRSGMAMISGSLATLQSAANVIWVDPVTGS